MATIYNLHIGSRVFPVETLKKNPKTESLANALEVIWNVNELSNGFDSSSIIVKDQLLDKIGVKPETVLRFVTTETSEIKVNEPVLDDKGNPVLDKDGHPTTKESTKPESKITLDISYPAIRIFTHAQYPITVTVKPQRGKAQGKETESVDDTALQALFAPIE